MGFPRKQSLKHKYLLQNVILHQKWNKRNKNREEMWTCQGYIIKFATYMVSGCLDTCVPLKHVLRDQQMSIPEEERKNNLLISCLSPLVKFSLWNWAVPYGSLPSDRLLCVPTLPQPEERGYGNTLWTLRPSTWNKEQAITVTIWGGKECRNKG